ncbi:MAG TPA: aldo/keto reductase [Hyphomicrobiaceae bacterium]|nr:aldo/keto reductase [Hyphomicrobiaceae bacterium]
MKTVTLGHSGLTVSRLCLGTMMFGGPTPEAEAHRIMDDALAKGVNFLDSANAYTEGRSEEVIGRGLKGKRDRWIVATKVGNPIGPGVADRGLTRRHVMMSCEASLRRLGIEALDILYIHKLDPGTSWEQTVLTFGDLIRQGKIREWALSNVRAWHIPHIHHLCRDAGVPAPTALQPYYNLVNRQPEVELLPAARHFGLGVVPYSPIARGVLTGKYKLNQTPEAGSRAARKDKRMMETEWRPESLAIAEAVDAHAKARGTTPVVWATAFVLANAAVTSVIAGPRTFEQWTSYQAALDYHWDSDDEALAARLVPPGHASTHGYTDPAYPVEGRVLAKG